RLCFTLDPLGNVAETRYDGEGRVTDTIRYATPTSLSRDKMVSLLSVVSTRPEGWWGVRDMQILLAAQSILEDFGTGADGLQLPGGNSIEGVYNLQINNSHASSSNTPVASGTTTYTVPTTGRVGFRFQLNPNAGYYAPDTYVTLGVQGTSTTGQSLRLAVVFKGDKLYVDQGNGSLNLLGATPQGSSWANVVEIEISATGQALIHVYPLGQTPLEGLTATLAQSWASASLYIAGRNDPSFTDGATSFVDNLMVYTVDANGRPRAPSSPADQHTINA
ncbi:MAG: hypothetical protein ABUL69_03675, partial [Peristeroidobacter soli]